VKALTLLLLIFINMIILDNSHSTHELDYGRKLESVAIGVDELLAYDAGKLRVAVSTDAITAIAGVSKAEVKSTDLDYADNTRIPFYSPLPEDKYVADFTGTALTVADEGTSVRISTSKLLTKDGTTAIVGVIKKFISGTQAIVVLKNVINQA
jgi:hypothetical protein